MKSALPLLTAATFVIGTGVYVHVGLLDGIATDLGVAVATAGLLGTVAGVLRAGVAPLAAIRTRGWDSQRTLTGGMALYALANVGAALSPSLALMMASQAVAAVAAAFVTPLALVVALAASPEDRQGRALASVMGGLAVAMVVGIPLGTVIGGMLGWRITYLLVAIGAVAVAGAIQSVTLPTQRAPVRTPSFAIERDVVLLLATMCLTMAAAFTVVSYIGPLLTEVAGVRGAAVGGLQIGMGVGSVLGLVVGGNAGDRLGRRGGALATALLIQAAMLMLFELVPTGRFGAPLVAGTVLLLATTSTFMVIPMIQVRLIARAPDSRKFVLALNGSAVFLGQGLGAALGSATLSFGTLHHLAPVGATVATAGALLALAVGTASSPVLSRT